MKGKEMSIEMGRYTGLDTIFRQKMNGLRLHDNQMPKGWGTPQSG